MSGLLDPAVLLTHAGAWVALVIAVLILVETGLLFPFLPGDSLIFTAALLGPVIGLPLWWLVVVVTAAAAAGDTVGYAIGRRWGRDRFRPGAKVLRPERLERADALLGRYGGRAVVLARFVPFARTFVPPAVGMSSMPYRTFLRWNVLGAAAWATGCALAGHWLGHVPFVAAHVDLIATAPVLLSVLPLVWHARRRARKRPAAPTADVADVADASART
ncbi:DedA family protein [Luteimicrobium subarcticum]|uniref:Membrane-associated protein n=1 Tax=Luteimicrobium subarcticum TaxID=620910 RepID=A0A2M8WUW7_9MICO|nr:DedA family protein [Luteimicrobium subarcticum]PJI94704.1 membrane-associated protein [Luteimicrobium subarcticum]